MAEKQHLTIKQSREDLKITQKQQERIIEKLYFVAASADYF